MDVSQGPTTLGHLRSTVPFFFLCIVECLTQRNRQVMKSLLSSLVWHFSSYWSIILSQPIQWPPCPRRTCGHANTTFVSTLCGCTGLRFLWSASISCFSPHLNTWFKVFITSFGLMSQTHPMALHVLFGITSDRNGRVIFVQTFLAILAVIVSKSEPTKIQDNTHSFL